MNQNIHALRTDVRSTDTIHDLLSSRRRRHVVVALSERNPPIALRELAAAVASREAETDSNEVSAEVTDEITVALHHVHLPKLDDADIVDYDAERNAVASARAEELASVVRSFDGSR